MSVWHKPKKILGVCDPEFILYFFFASFERETLFFESLTLDSKEMGLRHKKLINVFGFCALGEKTKICLVVETFLFKSVKQHVLRKI